MRVFMLGWEFPPLISGGLGTACFGLTRALARQGVHVTFVLPKAVAEAHDAHVRLLTPGSTRLPPTAAREAQLLLSPPPRNPNVAGMDSLPASPDAARAARAIATRLADAPETFGSPAPAPGAALDESEPAQADPSDHDAIYPPVARIVIRPVPLTHISPYARPGQFQEHPVQPSPPLPRALRPIGFLGLGPRPAPSPAAGDGKIEHLSGPLQNYTGDLFHEAQRYADFCVALARTEEFDVIHAHDWTTFPAGLAVAAATGKPLVVHVHSTEFDRSGDVIHQRIFEVERRGMLGAMRVLCVSALTASVVEQRYGIPAGKIDIVHNGVDPGEGDAGPLRPVIRRGEKVVLFLGRMTLQKGPEYFIRAAKRVLEKMDNVKFVMAGSGDRIKETVELAASEGVGHKVLFTGFLARADVEKVFRMADVYVMPSVSEPFGITPLEAASHDVPVIISKTSGVSEVLKHALKVDFWDVEDIADKIIAVLRHPPLSSTLREHADLEVRRLTWDDAAEACRASLTKAIAAMPAAE